MIRTSNLAYRYPCGAELRFEPQYMNFNPIFQCRVELPQPTSAAIEVLVRECLGHEVLALLTYAEIACDLIFSTRKEALQFQR